MNFEWSNFCRLVKILNSSYTYSCMYRKNETWHWKKVTEDDRLSYFTLNSRGGNRVGIFSPNLVRGLSDKAGNRSPRGWMFFSPPSLHYDWQFNLNSPSVTEWQNVGLVQIQSICRRHIKYGSNDKIYVLKEYKSLCRKKLPNNIFKSIFSVGRLTRYFGKVLRPFSTHPDIITYSAYAIRYISRPCSLILIYVFLFITGHFTMKNSVQNRNIRIVRRYWKRPLSYLALQCFC